MEETLGCKFIYTKYCMVWLHMIPTNIQILLLMMPRFCDSKCGLKGERNEIFKRNLHAYEIRTQESWSSRYILEHKWNVIYSFTPLFIHSFIQWIFIVCHYVPSTVLDIKYTTVKKKTKSLSHKTYILTDTKIVNTTNKLYTIFEGNALEKI